VDKNIITGVIFNFILDWLGVDFWRWIFLDLD